MTVPRIALGIAAIAITVQIGSAQAQDNLASPEHWEAYEAARAKTIVELQPFRQEQSVTFQSGATIRLISLNPNVNASFLLESGGETFHLDNPDPKNQTFTLVEGKGVTILTAGSSEPTYCGLLSGQPTQLETARKSGLPYAPVCGAKLYLRNAVSGSRSNLERITDFLRDHVWKGEEIVQVVKETFYKDKYAINSETKEKEGSGCVEDGPCAAAIDLRYEKNAIAPIGFGIALEDPSVEAMVPGGWYRVAGFDYVFASAIQPMTIRSDILDSPGNANRLDSIEGKAVDYLVAFDIDQYGLGFGLGTDHPRVDWSSRPAASVRVRGMPGPDGIGDVKPLVRSGMVSPEFAKLTIATFTGGFKRDHGAFKYGDYSTVDGGKHYGFIEQGVIYSKLKTGLSTLYVLDDGSIDMKAWTDEDNALLPRIAFARQNGVPLVTLDAETGQPVPGDLVNKWGAGNWSGSANADLRTLRAGACLQYHAGRRYLIYGYFSTATPSAMARTFQAYNCRHAMLLDMNALEHTYLALYPHKDDRINIEHLIAGMSALDMDAGKGAVIPRFLGFPDNRDFFFVYRREPSR